MLSVTQRKNYFIYLGLGTYNTASITKIQKKYLRSKDVDGKYGPNTDKLLVDLYRVKKYAPHFSITEFKCHCGGKYCTGYPAYLSVNLLINLEKIRAHFGVTHVNSGMRCKTWNSMQTGSATQSRHISGKAADISGKFTDTASDRASVKSYWYSLSKSNYCYYGTSNMGTAVHCDVK